MTDDTPRRSIRTKPGTTGQSETIGYLILLGVAFLAVTVLVIFGAGIIDTSRGNAEVSHAENSMAELDSKASMVAFDRTDHQRVDFGLSGKRGHLRTRPDAGWIRVRILNTTTGRPDVNVTNTTLGSVVYVQDGTRIAYQGGGVWRREGTRSTMVSPPNFDYHNETLTLPVISISGDRALDEQVRIAQRGPSLRAFPNRSAGLTNKLSDGKVTVTIHSEHYRAWGRYIEDRTNGYVFYDHAKQTVTVVFLVFPGFGSPLNGIVATSGAGQLQLLGTGAYVDSYNSTAGPYTVSQSNNGTVKAAGDVNMSGDSTINGTVRSGDIVALDSSSARINGDVYWTTDFKNKGTVTGINDSIDGIAKIPPITNFVEFILQRIRETNDNDATSVIQNENLDISGSSAELGPGAYYLETLDLRGKQLVLNTTDGNVTIAVEDWVRVDRKSGTGGNLTVIGDGIVRLYIGSNDDVTVSPTGLGSRDVNLHVGKESAIHVPGDRSIQFRIFGPDTFNATIAGSSGSNASATGVFYAPGGRTGPGYVYVKQADVYGAILTGNLTVGQWGAVHYDFAIQDARLPRSPRISRLEYLYVTVHRIEVE